MESVQTFGRKKTAVAVAYCKKGRGLIKVNGCPIELMEPVELRYKVFEPILLLGRERFANVDIRLRVKGGGYTSQIYAIRQASSRPEDTHYPHGGSGNPAAAPCGPGPRWEDEGFGKLGPATGAWWAHERPLASSPCPIERPWFTPRRRLHPPACASVMPRGSVAGCVL